MNSINGAPASGRKRPSYWERNRRSGGYLLRQTAAHYIIVILRALLVFGLCFMIIQPLISRLATSVMPEADLYDSTIIMLPRTFTAENYKYVLELTDLPRSILNSTWISLLMACCQLVSCTLVAYGFARYEFPMKRFWFGCVILMIIVPPQTIATSLYSFFVNFDILGIISLFNGGHPINIRGSLIPYSMMSLTCMGLKNGLYIYMMMQYFKGIPKELEEAAYVDGCGTIHTFLRIMIPDAMPIIASCFLFAFVWQWTDLFYSRNFLSSYSLLSTQLYTMLDRIGAYFKTNSGVQIVPVARSQQLVSIGVLICSTPLIILYCFCQKTFVESLASTGTKG